MFSEKMFLEDAEKVFLVVGSVLADSVSLTREQAGSEKTREKKKRRRSCQKNRRKKKGEKNET